MAELRLRPAQGSDGPLLLEIYASTRVQEFAQVPWTPQQLRDFLTFQSAAQERHYREVFPTLERLLIMDGEAVAGRLYRAEEVQALRVVDIALLPEFRGRGLGTQVLHLETRRAAAAGKPLELHVSRTNSVRRLYERLGFRVTQERELDLTMTWTPPVAVRSD